MYKQNTQAKTMGIPFPTHKPAFKKGISTHRACET